MKCAECPGKAKCMYTREGINGRVRRYVCLRCKGRFTTLEQRATSDGKAVAIIPDDVREKIYRGLAFIERALGK